MSVLESAGAVSEFLRTCRPRAEAPRIRVLMVTPDYYCVEYAINPHMKDASGRLKRVDPARAREQWRRLVSLYTTLGHEVICLPGEQGLPDLVFAANQSLPFWDASRGQPAVLMSRMRSPFRSGEVEIFARWFRDEGYRVWEPPPQPFEGNGDCLPDPKFPLWWGAYGERTDREAYSYVTRVTGSAVAVLELVEPEFYHLDTCFCLLGPDTVAIQPTAFSAGSLSSIRARFSDVIEVGREECLTAFATNAHCPGGQDVILHPGAEGLTRELARRGYRAHEIDVGEFHKSGGSVFCLKMMCY